MDRAWRAGSHLGESHRALRGARWGGLRVAGRGRRYGQGSFWGDQIGPNPTDRGKNGVKRSLLVEAAGGPLAMVIAGANIPDFKLLEATLEAIVIERSEPSEAAPQHLCVDKGYDKDPVREVLERYGYIPHIRRIGYEKKAANYLGLIKVACVLLWYRRQHRLSLLR